MKVIGLIGAVGSGKDTIAEYLSETKWYDRYAYASKVKDVAAIVFSWNREMLEGTTPKSRKWREEIDPYWNITPRQALQKIGTEMFRNHLDPDVWVKALVRELEVVSNSRKVVITDCRFVNEVNAVKDMGGVIIYVQRGSEPEWIDKAINALNDPESPDHQYFKNNNIHYTDWSIYALKSQADYIIKNDGTFDELYDAVDKLEFI